MKASRPGGAVFRLVDFARAKAVQQRAQNPPHMGVVVDDEETQAVEIDADHGAPRPRATRPIPPREASWGGVNEWFRIRYPAVTRAMASESGAAQSRGVLPMKTILIPTEDHDAMPAVLEAGLTMARIFDSYIEGIAVRPSAGTYVTVEPVSSLAISGAFDGDAARNAQRRVRSPS